jgi:hypothetical protein
MITLENETLRLEFAPDTGVLIGLTARGAAVVVPK